MEEHAYWGHVHDISSLIRTWGVRWTPNGVACNISNEISDMIARAMVEIATRRRREDEL